MARSERPASSRTPRGGGEHLRRELRVRHRRQLEHPHTARIVLEEPGRGLQAQTRLAAAAGTGGSEQACFGQKPLDLGDLAPAADEAGELASQIVGNGLERYQRWKCRRQTRRDDLKDVLGSRNVAQAVHAEVAELDAGWGIVAEHFLRGARDEDLAAVPHREQPRRVAQCEAGHVLPRLVLARVDLGGARVDGHADANRRLAPRLAGEGVLGGQRSAHARRDGVKGGAERVAHDLENVAAVRLDRDPQDLVMPGERDPHRLGVPLPEPRAALDVGEEKGDGTGREPRNAHAGILL